MIIDTSAIVAILKGESDARELVVSMKSADTPLFLSVASYMELGAVIDQAKDPVASRRVDDLIDALSISLLPVTVEQAKIARQAYRDFGKGSGHPAKLNFGDCFSYALAKQRGEPLLYKGSDFSHTDVAGGQ